MPAQIAGKPLGAGDFISVHTARRLDGLSHGRIITDAGAGNEGRRGPCPAGGDGIATREIGGFC
jgi:hypothetical protein